MIYIKHIISFPRQSGRWPVLILQILNPRTNNQPHVIKKKITQVQPRFTRAKRQFDFTQREEKNTTARK